jgi:hypothetical protein
MANTVQGLRPSEDGGLTNHTHWYRLSAEQKARYTNKQINSSGSQGGGGRGQTRPQKRCEICAKPMPAKPRLRRFCTDCDPNMERQNIRSRMANG